MISVLFLALPLLLAFVASFGIGIVMIIGGLKMMRLQSYGWATTASILALLPCSPVTILGLVVGIWSLVVLGRRDVKEAFDARATGRLRAHPFRSGPVAGTRARILLILAALLLVPLVLLLYWFGSAASPLWGNQGVLQIDCNAEIRNPVVLVQRDGRQVTLIDVGTRPWTRLDPGVYQLLLQSGSISDLPGMAPGEMRFSATTVTIAPGTRRVVLLSVHRRPSEKSDALLHGDPAEDSRPSTGWTMGPKGPALTKDAVGWLNLKPEQVEEVNKILEASFQEYLTLEAQNTERKTDDAGHVVITIKAFPKGIAKLEDQLWSQLDKILNTQQQSWARLNLKLDILELRPGMTLADTVRPGFFGWGRDGASIELWRVGSWSHWKVQTRGNVDASRAPQLPEEYRRFWTAPAAPEKAAD
jgi:hypothetical protein